MSLCPLILTLLLPPPVFPPLHEIMSNVGDSFALTVSAPLVSNDIYSLHEYKYDE